MASNKANQDESSKPRKKAGQRLDERIISGDEEKYTTDLDYISTWDVVNYQPSDSFMHGVERMFEDGAFDAGEEYPRGV